MIAKALAEKSAAMASYEVDHLGMVVPDLDAAAAFYRDVLGCPMSEPVVPPEQGIAVVFVPFRQSADRVDRSYGRSLADRASAGRPHGQ